MLLQLSSKPGLVSIRGLQKIFLVGTKFRFADSWLWLQTRVCLFCYKQ